MLNQSGGRKSWITMDREGDCDKRKSEEEEEEEERLLWQINNNTMLYMISFAKETPIKTCNMSLAWEPPYYNDIIILI